MARLADEAHHKRLTALVHAADTAFVAKLLAALLVLTTLPFASPAAAAPQARHARRPWSQSIEVAHPSAAQAYAANTGCAPLTDRVMKHINAIKVQTAQIEKARTGVAETLFGLFQKMKTGRYDGRAVERANTIIARERRLAADVNAILPSLGCAQIDIEAEIVRTYVPLDVSGLAATGASRDASRSSAAAPPAAP